ncbi:adenylyltransferase/cytidyltransferase family protein [Cupriavidus sp. 8B]
MGYPPGAYDLFHIGHLNLLRQAKEHCDILIAGVVADEVLIQYKGGKPASRVSVSRFHMEGSHRAVRFADWPRLADSGRALSRRRTRASGPYLWSSRAPIGLHGNPANSGFLVQQKRT